MNERAIHSQRGYTLIELLLVVGIIGVMGSMAVMQIASIRPGFVADGAMRVMMSQLNQAREEAIAHRRQIVVEFVGDHSVRLSRRSITGGPAQVLSTVPLEGNVRFGLVPGVPDTPDGFGNSSSPRFGMALTLRFNTDGMLVDSSNAPVNGTVFLLIQDQPTSFRAVTVLGATGRVRGYRWNGTAWTRV